LALTCIADVISSSSSSTRSSSVAVSQTPANHLAFIKPAAIGIWLGRLRLRALSTLPILLPDGPLIAPDGQITESLSSPSRKNISLSPSGQSLI
jgi:hypothetical protein